MTFWGGNAGAYDMVEYFPLNQGDTWIFFYTSNHPFESIATPYIAQYVINGTELVNGVETTKKVRERTDIYSCWAIDSEGVKRYKSYVGGVGHYVVYDPPEIILPARLDVGETYQSSFSASVYSTEDDSLMYEITGNNTVTLDSVEDVTVRTGDFKDCLKLIGSGKWQTADGSMTSETEGTTWYARNVGSIKEESTSRPLYPGAEDGEGFGTGELISATVDGVQYGYSCPATSVLGKDSNNLNILRRFRDEVLSNTPVGRKMIKLYYELSSTIVEAMEKNEALKEQVRKIIDGFLPVIRELVE